MRRARPFRRRSGYVPKTVTLEVDENDAKRLLVAAQLGKVTLAIRALAGAYAVPTRAQRRYRAGLGRRRLGRPAARHRLARDLRRTARVRSASFAAPRRRDRDAQKADTGTPWQQRCAPLHSWPRPQPWPRAAERHHRRSQPGARVAPATHAATTVFIADPTIADVQAPDPGSVVVFGKKPGTTRAYAFDGEHQIASYTVHVIRPTGDIERDLKGPSPGTDARRQRHAGRHRRQRARGDPAARRRNSKPPPASFWMPRKETPSTSRWAGRPRSICACAWPRCRAIVEKQFGFNWDALFNDGTFAIGLLTGRAPVSAFGTFNRDTSVNSPNSLGIGYTNGGSVNVSALLDALQSRGPGLHPGRAQSDHDLRRAGKLPGRRRIPGPRLAGPSANHDRVEALRRQCRLHAGRALARTASASR